VTIPAGQLIGVATGSYGCVGGGSLKSYGRNWVMAV
jgi:hypothetical protein